MNASNEDQPTESTNGSALKSIRSQILLSAILGASAMLSLLFFIYNVVMIPQVDIIDSPTFIVNAWLCGILCAGLVFTSVLSYYLAMMKLMEQLDI